MSTSNSDALQNAANVKEQQRIHRNMLRRTRYAQMSEERKQQFLTQQRAKRAESKRQRLLQHSSNTISSTQVECHGTNQHTFAIPDPSLCTYEGHGSITLDTTGCISIIETGSTSRGYDQTEKFPSAMATSNRAHMLPA